MTLTMALTLILTLTLTLTLALALALALTLALTLELLPHEVESPVDVLRSRRLQLARQAAQRVHVALEGGAEALPRHLRLVVAEVARPEGRGEHLAARSRSRVAPADRLLDVVDQRLVRARARIRLRLRLRLRLRVVDQACARASRSSPVKFSHCTPFRIMRSLKESADCTSLKPSMSTGKSRFRLE